MGVFFPKHISKREHPHRDLSTSLRFGRDDKGEGGASMGESLLNGDDKGKGGASMGEPLLNGDDKGTGGGSSMEEQLLNGDDRSKGSAPMESSAYIPGRAQRRWTLWSK